jgi:hypothetical protein
LENNSLLEFAQWRGWRHIEHEGIKVTQTLQPFKTFIESHKKKSWSHRLQNQTVEQVHLSEPLAGTDNSMARDTLLHKICALAGDIGEKSEGRSHRLGKARKELVHCTGL